MKTYQHENPSHFCTYRITAFQFAFLARKIGNKLTNILCFFNCNSILQ